ncbi:hypothetical protein [Rhizobium ruizarguesonis]|uniref:Uncharacterized protein n=1 Tax=Rhizobium ruizarguesonis TaxID=2081791 RepID=A0AAE8Q962_9HYPH|nr:hypothetical protein ELH53_01375 [Rhizobium ruizarguesonis]TBB20569.1 hypothetical protein ELH51_01370 [Rhizobium ruizarguesonis]TBD62173.1 hypothetical protein ELH22_01875 [Rhizobium ruizarguesonis]TBD78663.1 hypothetical protein ELH11_01430 [Rhizobium ruizarguesonis]TBE09819.1 hypothetical protein ELH09_01430 [Rhizobium ruizarguesonis]
MGLGRNLIQAAFLCGALAMPVLARGAEVSAEDALLTRLSIEIVPRLQREYLRATLTPQDEGTAIDVAAYVLSKTFNRWYVEGIFDGTFSWLHAPIKDEVLVTRELIELWQFSPFITYYLEVTEIPDCANNSVLLPSCR